MTAVSPAATPLPIGRVDHGELSYAIDHLPAAVDELSAALGQAGGWRKVPWNDKDEPSRPQDLVGKEVAGVKKDGTAVVTFLGTVKRIEPHGPFIKAVAVDAGGREFEIPLVAGLVGGLRVNRR